MRGKTSKLGWEWEKKQVNKDNNEMRNMKIRKTMRGKTSKLVLEWEEEQDKYIIKSNNL